MSGNQIAGFEDHEDGELSEETSAALELWQNSGDAEVEEPAEQAEEPASDEKATSSDDDQKKTGGDEEPEGEPKPSEEVTPESAPTDSAAMSRVSRALGNATDFAAARAQHKQQHQDPPPQVAKVASARETWQSDKVAAIRAQVADMIGTDDPAAVDGAMRNLFEDYTTRMLGADVDSSTNPAHSEAAQLRQKAAEAERRAAEAETKAQQQQSEFEYQRTVNTAKRNIAGLLSSEKYPFLMAQDDTDPADMVWSIIEQAIKDGETLDGDNAKIVNKFASEANVYFETKAKRFASLFTSSGDSTDDTKQVEGKSKPKQDESITNQEASLVPDAKSTDYIEDDEESVRSAFRFYQQQVAAEEE